MKKVHPKSSSGEIKLADEAEGLLLPTVLTVWKKSLMFSCSGFTVFDSKGSLVFRVDNYMAVQKPELVLMDAIGKSLLTMRRKKLRLPADNWQIYEGEGKAGKPVVQVKRHANLNLVKTKTLAKVFHCSKKKAYVIEGNYGKRCCQVRDESRKVVAEIKRKEGSGGVNFGDDIFRLIVQPGFDAAFAMAFVLLLDQMFSPTKWWLPLLL